MHYALFTLTGISLATGVAMPQPGCIRINLCKQFGCLAIVYAEISGGTVLQVNRYEHTYFMKDLAMTGGCCLLLKGFKACAASFSYGLSDCINVFNKR